jgi:hypothetical protein
MGIRDCQVGDEPTTQDHKVEGPTPEPVLSAAESEGRPHWPAILLSILALLVSAATAYFSVFRKVEELSLVVNHVPAVTINRSEEKIETSGSFEILFMNPGDRAIAVLNMNIALGQTSYKRADPPDIERPCETERDHTEWEPVEFEPIIVEAGKVLPKKIEFNRTSRPKGQNLHENRLWVPPAPGQIADGSFTYPQWMKQNSPYYGRFCLAFLLATASKAWSTRIQLRSDFDDPLGSYAGPLVMLENRNADPIRLFRRVINISAE